MRDLQRDIIRLSYEIARARANGKTARSHLLQRQRARLIGQVIETKAQEQAA